MKMQFPTCSNIRIRSTQDAHKIFYAVKQDLLQMVTRRLDADERSALCTGCVYAWEERGPHSELTGLGIERFTEGRRWSPSRVRDEFLFYYEKFVPPPESQLPGSSSGKLPPRDWDPLIKQTYSVWVDTQKGRRKWHLTAYFTQATVDRLGTVDEIPGVRDLVVPEGIFKSTRTNKSRSKTDEQARPSDKSRLVATVPRTFAPFPGPILYPINQSNHVQEIHTPSPPYTDHLVYSPYYQTQNPPTHVPVSLGTIHQYPRTQAQVQGSYQYPPQTVAVSQTNLLLEVDSKHGHFSKAESSFPKYDPVPQTLPVPSHARMSPETPQSHPGPAHVRGVANEVMSHGPEAHLHSAPRGYEPISFTNHLTANIVDNSDYMLGLPASAMHGNTYTSGQPTTHSCPQPYAEQHSQEKNPYLPPLHSVEAIQASVFALASPSEILIPIEDRKSTVGPNRDLAPLQSLARPCPYRREPLDDRTLRRLLRP